MRKAVVIPVILLLLLPVLAGCSGQTPAATTPATSLGRMLGYVPLSYLDDYDIWYTDPGTIKQRFGLPEAYNEDDIRNLPGEQGPAFLSALGALPVAASQLAPHRIGDLLGWDWTGIDRAVFHDTPPPLGFNVLEGRFDSALIGQKLLAQGYEKDASGSYTYYRLNGDMEINLRTDLGQIAMAQLNRVAVLDNRLVIAPATDLMTGVLDAMSGSVTSVIDDPASSAVATSLGDALGAVLITPDRVLKVAPGQKAPPFDLPAAASWGRLHDYALVGLGYRDDGTDRYLDIVLYYANKADAAADGSELVSRLDSYQLNIGVSSADGIPFTAGWQVGEPVVKNFGNSATLTVSNRYLPDATVRVPSLEMLVQMRDLLFLAPDPTPYLAAADDVINGPTGLNYRANLQQPGVWPPVETTTVEVGSPDSPARVTYRAVIETPPGRTANNIMTVDLPEPLSFGPDASVIVTGLDLPDGITVTQDTRRQSYPGDPVTRITSVAEIHVAATLAAGDYSFKLEIRIGDTDYGTVPCAVRVG